MADETMTQEPPAPEVGQWVIWQNHYQRTGYIGQITHVTPKLLLLDTSEGRYGARQLNRSDVTATVASKEEAQARVEAAEAVLEAHSAAYTEARRELMQVEHRRHSAILAALKGEAA